MADKYQDVYRQLRKALDSGRPALVKPIGYKGPALAVVTRVDLERLQAAAKGKQ